MRIPELSHYPFHPGREPQVTGWQPIERMVSEPIWVLKYDMYWYPKGHAMEGNACAKDEPDAQKFTSCHGWYSSESDALKVMQHFPKPCGYRLEKVWKRELL